MKDQNVDKLCALIASEIAANPFHLDGHEWAARPIEWWTAKLGKSERTLRDWIAKAGNVVRDRALVQGKVTAILRLGDPSAMTTRHMARVLEKVWKEKTSIPTSSSDFGRFSQLAKDWPDGYQPTILKHVLADWQLFMSAVDFVVTEINGLAIVYGEPPPLKKKFFKFPSLRVIVAFSIAAVESYEMHLQQHDPDAWSAFAGAVKAKAA